ncbi:DNA-binding protein [filamentous cyanobacterium CCT1]|nr:DNA-binding protein [filamentous cyanobacterium CCT1]PSN76447.1 DNA-binding protein [filamentous cyanobacterium CCP4]
MKFISTAALLTLGLSAMLPALAQTVPIQSLRQQNGITISGTVGSVVGNNFTLGDGTGEIIVDAGPRWYQAITVTPGEQLTVVGEYDNDEFDAYSITRASGEVITIRDGSGRPPWAGGPNNLR